MKQKNNAFTLKEVSRLLHVHENTLRLWDKKAILRASLKGTKGGRIYAEEDINDFIRSYKRRYSESVSVGINVSIEEIYKSSLRFMSPKKFNVLYKVIVQEAKRLISADYGSLILERDGILKRVYTTSKILAVQPVRQNGRTKKVFLSGKPMITEVKSINDIHPPVYKLGIRSIIFIPLAYSKKSVGVVNLLSRHEKSFSKNDLTTIRLFGSIASLAILNLRLLKDREKSVATRDLFLSLAAHEIKNPLTAISGYSQLILKKVKAGEMPDERWCQHVVDETMRTSHLINELTQITNIKQNTIPFVMKVHDISVIIDEVRDMFSLIHSGRVLKVHNNTKNGSVKIIGDSDKIIQVIINILNNAVKFSEPTTPIVLEADADSRFCHICIIDRGQGIKPEVLPHIFKPFFKGNRMGKEGLGIGLYLAKMIVERHNGNISVSSKSSTGTSINVSIPVYYG